MKRQLVKEAMTSHGLSQLRACGLIGITRRSYRRVATVDRNRELRERLRVALGASQRAALGAACLGHISATLCPLASSTPCLPQLADDLLYPVLLPCYGTLPCPVFGGGSQPTTLIDIYRGSQEDELPLAISARGRA